MVNGHCLGTRWTRVINWKLKTMLTELNQQILKFKTSTVYIELKFWNITLSKPKVPTTSIRSFRLQKNIKFLKHPFFYSAQQKHPFFLYFWKWEENCTIIDIILCAIKINIQKQEGLSNLEKSVFDFSLLYPKKSGLKKEIKSVRPHWIFGLRSQD